MNLLNVFYHPTNFYFLLIYSNNNLSENHDKILLRNVVFCALVIIISRFLCSFAMKEFRHGLFCSTLPTDFFFNFCFWET